MSKKIVQPSITPNLKRRDITTPYGARIQFESDHYQWYLYMSFCDQSISACDSLTPVDYDYSLSTLLNAGLRLLHAIEPRTRIAVEALLGNDVYVQ